MKALDILIDIRHIETEYDHYKEHRFDSAIKELEELIIDKDLAQKLFIEQELKHKKEIKELKIKFIEDIAFLKKDIKQ